MTLWLIISLFVTIAKVLQLSCHLSSQVWGKCIQGVGSGHSSSSYSPPAFGLAPEVCSVGSFIFGLPGMLGGRATDHGTWYNKREPPN